MKSIILHILMVCTLSSFGQSPFKNHINKPHEDPGPIIPAEGLPSMISASRTAIPFHFNTLHSLSSTHEAVQSLRVTPSGGLWIELKPNHLWTSRTSMTNLLTEILPYAKNDNSSQIEWSAISEDRDVNNISHIRIAQSFNGYPIHGQDMILHIENDEVRDINGFAWTGKLPSEFLQPVSTEEALIAAEQYLKANGVKFNHNHNQGILQKQNNEISLVWLPVKGKLILTYEIHMHPNLMDHWTLYVNAETLNIERYYSRLCSLFPKQLYDSSAWTKPDCSHNHSDKLNDNTITLLDGPTTISDQDLLGQSRTVNAYLVGTNFFMIDASRGGMFDGLQSTMPNEPTGVIWTIDGKNKSPQNQNFEAFHVTNTNNNWSSLEVSAHYNAGESYEYFRQKFNRSSLNGTGGNIISLINIADENGNGLDNAFWNGAAMYYGNGDVAFTALAKSLDVAGHEMSHGVIQNTANLEYMGQSGALNESFADVFGTMIDRNDWQLGEDVSNPNIFPTGALRDMSNPHNGGNGPNDPGWQPNHMNQYQNLPNTPDGDNGGVHVNSGIPNHAFFLLATNIGKDKAEQIYYKALKDYLVKSSQFIDMRIAVEKAATDLHGGGSAEVIAVRSAFDGVGIGAGQGGDYQDDIETNSGDDFILATDEQESDLYWIPPSNPDLFVKLDVPAPLSRPSFTDDGSSAVYVDQNNDMILINFNWSGGTLDYGAFFIENDPQHIWRNVVVSKDGSKIAYTTSELTNEIGLFDFNSNLSELYLLFNPTTAEGIQTGDVLYADAMEFDYSGEFIMYDALNRIESAFGDGIEYWDISFLDIWNTTTNTFDDGQIGKLYNSLPENISIGNPSFSKNSPYIITFDFFEEYRDQFGQLQSDYWIIAANIESGEVNNIYQNTTVGYPSYSRLDDKILFTFDDAGTLLLATIDIQPGNKTLPVSGTDVLLINGAQKGVWFQTGLRDFTATDDLDFSLAPVHVWPDPCLDMLHLKWDDGYMNAEYSITDLSGKVKLTGDVESGNAINVSALLPGPYFMLLRSDKNYRRAKFVKQ